ncbi:hypothetical protein C8R43DRAFT_997680 [Mycena crocata]|nr:hypothetical protein C8R43DRAFT_997680 [Mycena crocata]
MQLRNPFILQFPNLRAFRLRITIHLHGFNSIEICHIGSRHIPPAFHPLLRLIPLFLFGYSWLLFVMIRSNALGKSGLRSVSSVRTLSGTSSFLPTISTLAHFTSCRSCTSHSGLHPPPSRLVLRTPIFRSGPDLLDRLGPSALLCYPVLLCHSVYPLSSYSTFGLPFVIFKSLVPI